MMNTLVRPLRLPPWLVWLVMACLAYSTHGQRMVAGSMKNFTVPDYYPTKVDNTNWLRSILTGEEATPRFSGILDINKLRLVMFKDYSRETRKLETNLVIEADYCAYNQATRVLNSPGKLKVRSGDNRILIEGEGFYYSHTNYYLAVSNEVATTIEQPHQQARIFANSLEYLATNLFTLSPVSPPTNRVVVYHGDVRIDDPQFLLNCGRLAIQMPESGQSLENVLAWDKVKVTGKLDKYQAQAQRARYSWTATNEILELEGQATWQRGLQEGNAGRISIDRKRRAFAAHDQARTRIPKGDFSTPVSLLAPLAGETNAPASTNQFLEIYSDHSEVSAEEALFRGHVLLEEVVSNAPPAQVACGEMVLWVNPKNNQAKVLVLGPEMITNITYVAATNTVRMPGQIHDMLTSGPLGLLAPSTNLSTIPIMVKQGENWVSGNRMIFWSTNQVAEFTGQPRMQAGSFYQGQADRIRFQAREKKIHARGAAKLRLPMAAFNLPGPRASGGGTNAARSASAPQPVTWMEISAQEYVLEMGQAKFMDKVKANCFSDHQKVAWMTCEQMVARLTQPGNTIENLQAEGNFLMEIGQQNPVPGGKNFLKLTSGKAWFEPKAQLVNAEQNVELFLQGARQFTNGVYGSGKTFNWNMPLEQIKLDGNPVVRLMPGEIKGPVILLDMVLDRAFVVGGYQWNYPPPAKTNVVQKTARKRLFIF
jgi:lipopolysaccharide export system protein LptA